MAEEERGDTEPSGEGATPSDAPDAGEAQAKLNNMIKTIADAEARIIMMAEAINTRLGQERENAIAERENAIAERENAIAERDKVSTELAELKATLASDAARKVNEGEERSLGIREFVRQSLLDIMAGVDDAASVGKTRALNDGLDRFLPSVTMIGATAAEGSASDRVEFDLAVTVAQSESETAKGGTEVHAGLQVSAPWLGKFHVGASGHIERVTTEASFQEQANRLRFAVPIVYALQGDSADEE